MIDEFIHYYNHKRIQGTLDYQTPNQYMLWLVKRQTHGLVFLLNIVADQFLEPWKPVKCFP
ncbi:IS3 family transposase [Bacillus sp. V3B]|nr:IS3 family transposase [Bacillus sp. V3B]